jgi:hypothetical protein
MTNSTTLEGWLRKTNFSKLGDKPIQASVHFEAARMHTMNYMTTSIREYNQWFKGQDNMVSNSLLRDNNWSDVELTHFLHTLSIIDSAQFQDSMPAQQSYLAADCVPAQVARVVAVQQKTHNDQSRLWNRWTEYCGWMGLSDPFLDNFPCPSRIKHVGTFAMAMRKARFSGPSYDQLAHGLVTSAILHVCQTFCEHGQPTPSLDDNGMPGFLL